MPTLSQNPNAAIPGRLTLPEKDLLSLLETARQKSWLLPCLIFLLSFCADLLFVALKGWPLPSLHDEFSYLLSADTFASGHLSNPSHPFSRFFETFHVLQTPAYASKYPPLQGLILALGQCLGHPALGVFLASSASIAASYWMLRSVFTDLWSLFGVTIIWLQLAPYTVYSCSYMGSSTSVLGSCLLLGAGFRICRSQNYRIPDALALSAGVWILAASRPFEGAILSFTVAVLLCANFWILPFPGKKLWCRRILLPGSTALLLGSAFLLFYNHAVTGHALRLPYSVYEASHSRTPLFLWDEPRANALVETPNLERFEREFTAAGFQSEKHKSFMQRFWERLNITLRSFSPVWIPGTLLLLLSVFSSRGQVWFCWLVFLIFILACSNTTWFSRHYLGGIVPFLALLWTAGGEILFRCRAQSIPWGQYLVRLGLWLLLAMFTALMLMAPDAETRVGTFATNRHRLQQDLLSQPGQDLVFVSYVNHSDVSEEWVYNSADIDHSGVVWAHDLGKTENEKLIRYFSNRRIWNLEINRDEPHLKEIFIPPSP